MDFARPNEGNEADPLDGNGFPEGTCLLRHLEAHSFSALNYERRVLLPLTP